MNLPRIRFRSLLSFVLIISLASIFSLGSFAAAGDEGLVTKRVGLTAGGLLDAPAATLMASGEVDINGYRAETGATVLSGSQIATRRNSIATVDLGSLGRVILRPDTSIQLNLAPGTARVNTQSEHVRVVVLHGQLSVASNRGNYTLVDGEDIEFAGAVEAIPDGGTVFTVQNQGTNPAPGQDPNQTGTNNPPPKKKKYPYAPWWGYVAFAGVAGGIAAGVVFDNDGSSNSRVVSNPKP